MSEKHWHDEFKKYVRYFPQHVDEVTKAEGDKIMRQSQIDPTIAQKVRASAYRADMVKEELGRAKERLSDPAELRREQTIAAKQGKTLDQLVQETIETNADNRTVYRQARNNAYNSVGKELLAKQNEYGVTMNEDALRGSLREDHANTISDTARAAMLSGGVADPDTKFTNDRAEEDFQRINPEIQNAAKRWPDILTPMQHQRAPAPQPAVQAAPMPQVDSQGTQFNGEPSPAPAPAGPQGASPTPAAGPGAELPGHVGPFTESE